MKKRAQAFGRILRNRWLLLAIGLLCISALVWFLGPLILIGDVRPLESVDARLLTILVLVVLWGVNNLRLGFQERQRSKKINAELAGSGDALADPAHRKAAAEEIAVAADATVIGKSGETEVTLKVGLEHRDLERFRKMTAMG